MTLNFPRSLFNSSINAYAWTYSLIMLKIGSSSTKQAGLDKHVRVEHGVELSMVYGDAVTQQLHWSARGQGGRGGAPTLELSYEYIVVQGRIMAVERNKLIRRWKQLMLSSSMMKHIFLMEKWVFSLSTITLLACHENISIAWYLMYKTTAHFF